MAEMTRSVTEIFDQAAPTDSRRTFDELTSIMSGLHARVLDRFDLAEDPAVSDLASFGGESGPRGSFRAWSGPGMDWLVHSWIGDPEAGFTNIHLTAWLGPATDVPHLGIACGTLPTLWCFVDLLPRTDLLVDPDYVDRYYEPANEAYMALKNDPEAESFISQDTFTRAGVSQSAFCVVLPTTPERVTQIGELATLRLEQWFGYLDEASPVPEADRPALAARDQAVRRNIAERDPANALAERFFGKDLTDRLVGSLWGDGRATDRPDR